MVPTSKVQISEEFGIIPSYHKVTHDHYPPELMGITILFIVITINVRK